MTNNAAFAHRFVFINKWTALGGVTLKTGVILAQECLAAAMNVLGHARAPAFHRAALVRFMTIGASHLPFQDRVVMRQLKLRADIEMALETSLWRALRIDDQVRCATVLGMETSGPVTRLTPDVHRVCSRRF